MEHDFWHEKWSEGRIGFHQADINSHLKAFWQQLDLAGKGQVFVPLCGKSQDMLWLQDQGHDVLGIELNRSACDSFFSENGYEPVVETVDDFARLQAGQLSILCGDFFQLRAQDLQQVKGVYDRAALVALPQAMRERYARTLVGLLPQGVAILLVTLEFDSPNGPPFNVSDDEVQRLFAERFNIERLNEAKDGEKREVTWALTDRF